MQRALEYVKLKNINNITDEGHNITRVANNTYQNCLHHVIDNNDNTRKDKGALLTVNNIDN